MNSQQKVKQTGKARPNPSPQRVGVAEVEGLLKKVEGKMVPILPGRQMNPEKSPGLHTHFIDRNKFKARVERDLKNCPEAQKSKYYEWIAKSPNEVDPDTWQKGDVPKFLGINSPREDFFYRLDMLLDCAADGASLTVEDYARTETPRHRFPGAVIAFDQEGSTASTKGLVGEELNPAYNTMVKILRCAGLPFMAMRDVSVGDGFSFAVMTPGDNRELAATDGIRMALLAQELFSTYNKIVSKLLPSAETQPIKMRCAVGLGEVFISKIDRELQNMVDATVFGGLITFTARAADIAPPEGVVINSDAYEAVKRHFEVEELDPAKILSDMIYETEQELSKIQLDDFEDGRGNLPLTREDTLRAYELTYKLAKINHILFEIFEKPNMESSATYPDGLEFRPEYRRLSTNAKDIGDHAKSVFECTNGHLQDIEEAVDLSLTTKEIEKLKKMKTKGYSRRDYKLYHVTGYKRFKDDFIATPKESLFRKLFLEDHWLEDFLRSSASRYGVPTRTNLDLFAMVYGMYTIQHTGSPSYASNAACRATGLMTYMLAKMQQNWNVAEDAVEDNIIERVKKNLVKEGIFTEKGEVKDMEKMRTFLIEYAMLPALLAEMGILKLTEHKKHKGAAYKGAHEMGKAMSRTMEDLREDNPALADMIKFMPKHSSQMFAAMNEEVGAEKVPQATIDVLSQVSYGKEPNPEIMNATGNLAAFGAQVVQAATTYEAMTNLKAYRTETEPYTPNTIYAALRKSSTYIQVVHALGELMVPGGLSSSPPREEY